jgi:hypothetical protein
MLGTMTNTHIQANLILGGRGHTQKSNEGYVSGEYNRLVNAEINEAGNIVSRRPIKAVGIFDNNRRIEDPQYFIGNIGGNAAFISNSKVYVSSALDNTYDLWDLSNLSLSGSSYRVVKKVIRYNNITYFIALRYNSANTTYYIDVAYCNFKDTVFSYSVTKNFYANFANYTVATLFSRPASEGDLVFVNAFIHKDRLWVVCEDQVWFSKPTDPLTFSVPNGGFFKFPHVTINDACANKDNIYIIGNGSIEVITYTTDPNTDAVVRGVTGSLGGDSCCVHEDSVYTIKDEAIYYLSGSNVTKVYDLEVGFLTASGNYTKIASFGPYLVFLRWHRGSYEFGDFEGSFNEYGFPAQSKTKSHPIGSSRLFDGTAYRHAYHMFFLHMGTGAIHVVDFRDGYNVSSDPTLQGIVGDMMFLPLEDGANNFHLFMMTKQRDTSTASGTRGMRGSIYTMAINTPPEGGQNSYLDEYIENSSIGVNVKRSVEAQVDIEIRHYVPDGNEFNFKKFRNIMIQGKFPQEALQLQYAFDNREYGAPLTIEPHYSNTLVPTDPRAFDIGPSRFPINQRARAISLRIKNKPNDNVYSNGQGYWDSWSIEDVKILWQYTSRGPISRSQGRYIT